MERELELCVEAMEAEMVIPSLPSPKAFLCLSNIDDQPLVRTTFTILLVYSAPQKLKDNDPVKVIREALSKVLVYYYPLAGRLRNTENGKLQVECTGEGAVFVEATAHNTLSVLEDFERLKPSFEQLFYHFPPNTDIEDFHPLAIQVTRFKCGGLVVGATFHHTLYDGIGTGKFLKHLTEMARGETKLSTEPIWDREMLKPRNPPHVKFLPWEASIEENICLPPPPRPDEKVEASLVLNLEAIKVLKQNIMEECKEICTTFEILAAMAWRARTKALQIPHDHNVMLVFAVNVRAKVNPPLPEGYYGNVVAAGCAVATAQELTEGSLLHAIRIIQKTKHSVNDEYFRSRIDFMEINRQVLNGNLAISQEYMFLTDWRWLGYYEVDFGWGTPIQVSPGSWNIAASHAPYFALLRGPNCLDGIKLIAYMLPTVLKLFESEMQLMISKYTIASNHSK